jgi:hypothetical protein
MEKKLELSQLKNYLGTGLKIKVVDETSTIETLVGIYCGVSEELITEKDSATIDICFPICYRLQDLDKFIEELGFVPAEKLYFGAWALRHRDLMKDIHLYLDRISFEDSQKLFQWNFWVFDQSFFEEGLIIDKLKL